MLAIIQRLDPSGTGARDLRECLLIQLVELGDTTSLTYRLVNEAFPDLIAHRWNDLAKRFGVEPAAVQAAADQLSRLDPKPGLKYSEQSDGYIIPDLIVEKIGGRYQVFLNDTGMPRLRAEPLLSGDRPRQEEDDAGKSGVHRLEDEQRQLDDSGHRAAAADDAQGHELHRRPAARLLREGNRVSQAAHPPRGGGSHQHARIHRQPGHQREVRPDSPGCAAAQVLLLQALSTASGEDASARSIRAKLEKMVGEENSAKPLTDQQIVHLFQEQGIQIARRTVAKYRDQLGILPARMRKRV